MVLGRLRFGRRADGARVLTLAQPIPELGVRADDRLEPTESLPDVSLLADLPFTVGGFVSVVFWRSASDTLTRRRNHFSMRRTGPAHGVSWRRAGIAP